MQADGGRVLEGWPFPAEAATPRALPHHRHEIEQPVSGDRDGRLGRGATLLCSYDACVGKGTLLDGIRSQSSKSGHDGEADGDVEDGDAEDNDDALKATSPLAHQQGIIWKLMPMLQALRLTLMLPVAFSKNGAVQFSWRSLPMALTFVAWLVMAVQGFLAVRYYLDPSRNDRHVWNLVSKYWNGFVLGLIFYLPYTSWGTTTEAVSMLDEWQRVERMVTALRGSMPVPGMRRRAWCYSLMSVIIPATIFLLRHTLVYRINFFAVPIMLHLFTFAGLATSFWSISCRGLASVARMQAAHLDEDFQRLGVAALRSHRRTWLSMVRVLDLLSACWGRTNALLLLMSTGSCVVVGFLLIVLLVYRQFDGRLMVYCIVFLYNSGNLVSVCQSAQIATDAMREPTKKQLLLLSLAHRDKATLTEFVALANTYVVVLAQFAISVEETNNTT